MSGRSARNLVREIHRIVLDAALARRPAGPRRRRLGDEAGEPMPVEPNRPLDLTGGAAAPLDFER